MSNDLFNALNPYLLDLGLLWIVSVNFAIMVLFKTRALLLLLAFRRHMLLAALSFNVWVMLLFFVGGMLLYS